MNLKDFLLEHAMDFVFTAVIGWAVATIKKERSKYASVQEGIVSLLRSKLIEAGENYLKNAWVPTYKKEAYDKLYNAYHNLGGNGSMTELHAKVMELSPIDPEKAKEGE